MAIIQVGVIGSLQGQVSVVHSDGSSELLQVGSKVYADDVIRTSANSSVDLKLPDGSVRHVGPGSMASLGEGAPAPGSESPARLATPRADDADVVQSILEDEDPTETVEPPAAGEEPQEDSGTTFVRLQENGRRVTPESGHETTGIGYGFTDVDEELLQTPVNRAPEPRDDNSTGADDDALATRENTPITIDTAFLLANDSDPDGDPLTFVSVGDAVHGTVELQGDQVLYTPDPGFYGNDTFEYTVTDGSLTASATVGITVDSIPDAGYDVSAVDESAMSPTVSTGPQTVSADFGDDGPGELNGNGSFAASTALTSAGQPVTVSVDANGNYVGTVNGGSVTVFTLVFDPAGAGYQFTLEQALDHPDSSDPDDTVNLDFGYTATDNNGDAAVGTITIVVSDDGPSIPDAGGNTEEETPVSFNVFDHATPGADGAILKAVSLAVADDGVITTFDAAGNVTYVPAPGYEGTAVINYVIEDGDGDQAGGQFSVTVAADSEPSVPDDGGTVDESALATGSGGGTDTTGGALSIDTGGDTLASLTVNGEAVAATGTTLIAGVYGDLGIDIDGNWSYTLRASTPDHPGINQTGAADKVQDSFTVLVTDSDGDLASSDLVININDDGPQASTDSTATAEDAAVTYNVLADDIQGADGATLLGASLNTGAGVVGFDAGGDITFMPARGFEGLAVIDYTIEDADGDQSSAQLTVDVAADSQPVVSNDGGTVDESALATGSGGGTDTTGGSLNIDTGGDTLAGLTVNGEAVAATGTTLISGVYGDLGIDIDGNWNYTLRTSTPDHPGIDQTGAADQMQDSFSVLVVDSDGDTAGSTLTINVNDDGPVAVTEGTVTVSEGASTSGNLLVNDTPGADGASLTHVNGSALVFDPLSGEATVVTALGTLRVMADGDYHYTANDNSNGTDVFSYTLTDADGDSAQSTVSFALQDINAPTAGDSSGTVEEAALPGGSDAGSPNESTAGVLSFSTGNDLPHTLVVNGEAVAATGTTVIAGVYGDLGIDIDGNWNYTLRASTPDHTEIDQTGAADQVQDVFSFTITDNDGDPASGNLTINVNDDGPSAASDSSSDVAEGTASLSTSLTSLVSDAGADGASVTAVNGTDLTGSGIITVTGSHGALVVDLDGGTFEYQANDNAAGTDVFTFTVTDGDQDTDSVVYRYTVVDANEPGAGDLVRTVDEAALVTGSNPASDNESTSGNLADLGVSFSGDIPGSLSAGAQSILIDGIGGDSITVSGAYGDWLIHDDGSWTYTLNGNTGAHSTQGTGADGVADVFSYTVTDSDGDQASGSLTVSIQDDIPTAIADPAAVELRDGETSASSTLAALIAVAGADGASATSVNGVDLAGNGIVTVDGDNGSLVLNLDNGSFAYHANTDDSGTDSFEFTITDGDGDTDTVVVAYDVSDRPNLVPETYVWMPVDQAQQVPGYESGYPIGLRVSDLDSTLTVTITEVPDDGQAGYYDGNNTFVPLNAGDTFVLAAGEAMPQVVYLPPDVDLETVVDPITDIVSFTVTEDGDPLTTQSGTININAMPPYDLPGQEALIGDGNSPLTSGNDLDGELVIDNNLVTAITRDIDDDGAINSSFIELFTDFQQRPSSGGIPIPDDHRADAELEATVSAKVFVDGIEFVVIAENDALNQWAFDSDSGLMKAVVDYNDVVSADAGIFDGSLADYLTANPPATGDTWTVVYQDSGSGNEQARFMKFDFTYDNPGDPSINVIGGADAPNIIYGSSGNDSLTGGDTGDEIYARGGDDVLVGGAGDDIFIGGAGDDQLGGDSGADRFVIRSADEGVDTIMDYSNNESDVIDISDILTGFDPENDTLSDFVSITSDGTDATVAVDPGGAGSYMDIALLSNVTAGTLVTIQISEDATETLIVA